MEITSENWSEIRRVFHRARMSSVHYSLATVSEEGEPFVSPVGSLILGPEQNGYYFEKFFKTTTKNLASNQKVCILAVNSSRWFWLKSLSRGRFPSPPGVRIMGTVGERRQAKPEEVAKWLKIIKPLRFFKGYHLLWSDMDYVREIHFDSFEPIQAGSMTKGLWS